eukprot:2062799-Pyramimonas_sp.AAC.1
MIRSVVYYVFKTLKYAVHYATYHPTPPPEDSILPETFTDAEKVPETVARRYALKTTFNHRIIRFSPQVFADTTCPCQATVSLAATGGSGAPPRAKKAGLPASR